MTWLRDLLKSSYTRLLEKLCDAKDEEIARLRSENRAMLNSLLATAGCPPVIELEKAAPPAKVPMRGMSWHQRQTLTERQSEQRMLNRQAALRPPGGAIASSVKQPEAADAK
ncbi:MAG TPA: hypothetical protein VKQ28_00755 [Candidatus Acidoferrum sp.]|nr:hypothetical protein [Candidatus Acidoferrum sp.]